MTISKTSIKRTSDNRSVEVCLLDSSGNPHCYDNLSAKEARLLAYGLLAEAEEIGSK